MPADRKPPRDGGEGPALPSARALFGLAVLALGLGIVLLVFGNTGGGVVALGAAIFLWAAFLTVARRPGGRGGLPWRRRGD